MNTDKHRRISDALTALAEKYDEIEGVVISDRFIIYQDNYEVMFSNTASQAFKEEAGKIANKIMNE